jgi:hypothetical protein
MATCPRHTDLPSTQNLARFDRSTPPHSKGSRRQYNHKNQRASQRNWLSRSPSAAALRYFASWQCAHAKRHLAPSLAAGRPRSSTARRDCCGGIRARAHVLRPFQRASRHAQARPRPHPMRHGAARAHTRLTIHHKFRSNLAELRQKACRERIGCGRHAPERVGGHGLACA